LALRKAAVWALVAGLCHIAATEFAPGSYPSWYFALSAVGYGLLLPVIASLHVRHEPLRGSGTVLGTIAVTCASINTIGGFLITDRMLRMFKHREPKK